MLIDVHQIGMGETGNETWARNVMRVLEIDGRRAVHYAASPAGLPEVESVAATSRVHMVSASSSRRLALDLPALLRTLRPAAVLAQYTLPLSRTPGVVVVHDLSFERSEARAWIPRRTLLRYRLTIGTSVRQARAVLVPTEYTREEVVRHYRLPSERVLVAPLALDPGLKLLFGIQPEPRAHTTVLAVGTVLPRKNLTVVARAVRALRAEGLDVRFRLVGPIREAGRRDVAVMSSLLGSALEVVGPVPVERLAAEYGAADAFAFPSLFEGFGLPLLEAMGAGVPVISSNATCLPEVVGQAALLVDPRSDDAWTSALRSVLSDPALASSLSERGRERAAAFTWDRTGAVVRQALELASG